MGGDETGYLTLLDPCAMDSETGPYKPTPPPPSLSPDSQSPAEIIVQTSRDRRLPP